VSCTADGSLTIRHLQIHESARVPNKAAAEVRAERLPSMPGLHRSGNNVISIARVDAHGRFCACTDMIVLTPFCRIAFVDHLPSVWLSYLSDSTSPPLVMLHCCRKVAARYFWPH